MQLQLSEIPHVDLIHCEKEAAERGSFGSYSPSDKAITVIAAGRHTADILRTLAHELVHHKQNLEGKLVDISSAGETGSEFENEANSQAGILLRNYGKLNRSIYELV
jgi:hypothetical protein